MGAHTFGRHRPLVEKFNWCGEASNGAGNILQDFSDISGVFSVTYLLPR